MQCSNCGSKKAWWIKNNFLVGERCSECSPESSPDLSNISWKQHKVRVNAKATQHLNSNKHTYVPPLTEGSVGGVFMKGGK